MKPRIVLLLALAMACGEITAPATDLSTLEGVVVVDGNSMSDPVFNDGLAWPELLRDAMQPSALVFRNVAKASAKMRTLVDSAKSRVDPFLALEGVHVVILWEGINDLDAEPYISMDSAFKNVSNYATARRALGWKVIHVSVVPHPGVNELRNDRRLQMNAWLRANWRQHGDGFVDLDADPIMGWADSATTAPYFRRDRLHPSPKGHIRIAGLVRPELERVLRLP